MNKKPKFVLGAIVKHKASARYYKKLLVIGWGIFYSSSVPDGEVLYMVSFEKDMVTPGDSTYSRGYLMEDEIEIITE